jgi:hypothetical protein
VLEQHGEDLGVFVGKLLLRLSGRGARVARVGPANSADIGAAAAGLRRCWLSNITFRPSRQTVMAYSRFSRWGFQPGMQLDADAVDAKPLGLKAFTIAVVLSHWPSSLGIVVVVNSASGSVYAEPEGTLMGHFLFGSPWPMIWNHRLFFAVPLSRASFTVPTLDAPL